jgi:thioredoxin-related protein
MHTTLDYIASQVYLTESYADYLNKLKKNKTGKLNSHTIFASPPHLLMRSKNRPAQKVLAVFFEEPNCTQCDFFHTQLMPLKQTQDYLQQMR